MADPLKRLDDGLIPAAMREGETRGRKHPEEEHPYRSCFQRDRDRIIHSAHFRRLEYKTQVFVNGEGDNYRTRLTHTLEVTQIARTIARSLGLNEDLSEAVALSHDLGHTPFGHAGERVLNELMREHGGFNHNAQGLRIVDLLESRYPDFDGLNLTYEVREAFVRHGGESVAAGHEEFPAGYSPLLEVAVTLVADDIAYIAHDIDDGLFSRIVDDSELMGLELWQEATAGQSFSELPPHLKRTAGVRRLINLLVTDVLEQTRANIVRLQLTEKEAVQEEKKAVVTFSPEVGVKKKRLKDFLFHNFYRHPIVMRAMEEPQRLVRELWVRYCGEVEKMPAPYVNIADNEGIYRAATDYVSGMTDRFAREIYRYDF